MAAGRRCLPAVFLEIFLHFQCRHAPAAGGGNGLTVAAVLHIAAGKDTGHAGEYVVVGA